MSLFGSVSEEVPIYWSQFFTFLENYSRFINLTSPPNQKNPKSKKETIFFGICLGLGVI